VTTTAGTGLATSLPVQALPPAEWSRQIHGAFFPLELSAREPDQPFLTAGRTVSQPRARLAEIIASDHRACVTRAACSQLDQRYLKLVWLRAGSLTLEQGDHATTLHGGQWTVYEASRPYAAHMGDAPDFVVMLLPMSNAPGTGPALLAANAGRAQDTVGESAVALHLVQAAVAQSDRLAPGTLDLVAAQVGDLLMQGTRSASAAAPALPVPANPAATGQVADRTVALVAGPSMRYVHAQALALMQSRLHDPALSPDDIARALHISRRSLYLAFEHHGESPQACLQRLRLERCRHALESARAPASITALALDHGFNDPAYFSRVFRRHYGQTPSAWRRQIDLREGGSSAS